MGRDRRAGGVVAARKGCSVVSARRERRNVARLARNHARPGGGWVSEVEPIRQPAKFP